MTDDEKAEAVVDGLARCTVPPTGWECTRDAGHNGPCAAIRAGTDTFNTWGWLDDIVRQAVAKEREQGRRRELEFLQRIAELEARIAELEDARKAEAVVDGLATNTQNEDPFEWALRAMSRELEQRRKAEGG